MEDGPTHEDSHSKYRGGGSAWVDVEDLLQYSHLIANTSFAGGQGNPSLMDLYHAPMPVEQQIQSGCLYTGHAASCEQEVDVLENPSAPSPVMEGIVELYTQYVINVSG
jgi:hypothetical protein